MSALESLLGGLVRVVAGAYLLGQHLRRRRGPHPAPPVPDQRQRAVPRNFYPLS